MLKLEVSGVNNVVGVNNVSEVNNVTRVNKVNSVNTESYGIELSITCCIPLVSARYGTVTVG